MTTVFENKSRFSILPMFKYKILESLRSTRAILFFVICCIFGIILPALFLSPEFVALLEVVVESSDRVQIMSTVYYHYFVSMAVSVMAMLCTVDVISGEREEGLIHYLQSKPISRIQYYLVATIPITLVLMGLFITSALVCYFFFWIFGIEMALDVFMTPFIAFTLLIIFNAMLGALASAVTINVTKSLLIIIILATILILIGEGYRFVPMVYAQYESYGIIMPISQEEATEMMKELQKLFPSFWAYNTADNIRTLTLGEIAFAFFYIPAVGALVFIIGAMLYKRVDL